jgi:hypothetical protein
MKLWGRGGFLGARPQSFVSHSTSVCSLPYLTCLTRLSNVYLCSPYRPHDAHYAHNAHNAHSPHNPDTPHDPRTRPLAALRLRLRLRLLQQVARLHAASLPLALSLRNLANRATQPAAFCASQPSDPPPISSQPRNYAVGLAQFRRQRSLSRLTPSSTATSHALAVLHRRPNRLQHAIAVGYIQATGQKA